MESIINEAPDLLYDTVHCGWHLGWQQTASACRWRRAGPRERGASPVLVLAQIFAWRPESRPAVHIQHGIYLNILAHVSNT